MTCHDVRNLAPLYLSGEIDIDDRRAFTAHLAACPACEQEIENQALLDARLAGALWRETPDTQRVEHLVRRHISGEFSRRRRWIAAGLLVVISGGVGLLRLFSAPQVYVDAARDHQAEVIEKQPRRWRSGGAEIDVLAVQNGLSFARVAALASPGYSLEQAKICGLAGQRMLHLVFANGRKRYSVYLCPHQTAKESVRILRRNSEQVAGFETGRFRAFVVTDGPAPECEELARLTAERL